MADFGKEIRRIISLVVPDKKISDWSNLGEVKTLDELGDQWMAIRNAVFAQPLSKIDTPTLILVRDCLWRFNQKAEVHSYYSTINTEIDRRSALQNHQSSWRLSLVALIVSLIGLFADEKSCGALLAFIGI